MKTYRSFHWHHRTSSRTNSFTRSASFAACGCLISRFIYDKFPSWRSVALFAFRRAFEWRQWQLKCCRWSLHIRFCSINFRLSRFLFKENEVCVGCQSMIIYHVFKWNCHLEIHFRWQHVSNPNIFSHHSTSTRTFNHLQFNRNPWIAWEKQNGEIHGIFLRTMWMLNFPIGGKLLIFSVYSLEKFIAVYFTYQTKFWI